MKLLASLALLTIVGTALPGSANLTPPTNSGSAPKHTVVHPRAEAGNPAEVTIPGCQPPAERRQKTQAKSEASRAQSNRYDRPPRLCDQNEPDEIDDQIK